MVLFGHSGSPLSLYLLILTNKAYQKSRFFFVLLIVQKSEEHIPLYNGALILLISLLSSSYNKL